MKLVVHNSSRVWGGNEKWLATLSQGLIRRGHEVVVSCHTPGAVQEGLAARGVPTSGVRLGGELDLPRVLRFTRWLARERPDAVLLTSWTRTPWAAWAARRAGAPRVVVRLGIVRSAPRRGRHARAVRHRIDALIVNSSAIRERWIETAPWFPADQVHVVLNGIVLPAEPGQGDGAALKRVLGLPPEVPLLAGVGHVTHRKGFDLMLDALARVTGAAPHLAIVGTGPAEEELRRQAARSGLEGRVHWLGFRTDVVDILRGCDLFLLGSRNEGMANVMLEAMAAGTPVVATDISGVREALDAREGRPAAGWVVPPDDAQAMAGAISEVVADLRAGGAVARARVAEGLRRIEAEFGVERMVDQAERILFPPGARAG